MYIHLLRVYARRAKNEAERATTPGRERFQLVREFRALLCARMRPKDYPAHSVDPPLRLYSSALELMRDRFLCSLAFQTFLRADFPEPVISPRCGNKAAMGRFSAERLQLIKVILNRVAPLSPLIPGRVIKQTMQKFYVDRNIGSQNENCVIGTFLVFNTSSGVHV